MESRLIQLILACGSLLAFVGCTDLISSVSRSSQDWRFVQSVGGMALGTPARDDRGHVLLPIHCDVATTNSGMVCLPPWVRVRGRMIYLTLRTSLPAAPYDSRCPPADLGALAPGGYSVVYRSPGGDEHALGSIQLPQ